VACLSPGVFIFSRHKKTAKGTAIPINNPLTELNPRTVVIKRVSSWRQNHGKIIRYEENTGYTQHHLALFGPNTVMSMATPTPAARFVAKCKALTANMDGKTPKAPYTLNPT